MNPDQMNMAIPHARHQDLDMGLGKFGVMNQDIFRGADVGDFGVFDNYASIEYGFATPRNEEVGGDAERVVRVLTRV